MVAYSFNSGQHDPNFGGGLGQLPPCKKTKVIAFESSQQPTKDGRGGYLQFLLRVVEGPLQGREGYINFQLHNVVAKTVEIANQQLSAFCHAVRVPAFTATEQLHNIPFLVDVDWQKGNEPTAEKPEGGYTEVKALYDVSGQAPGKGKPAAAAAPVAPPPAAAPPAAQPASQPPAWQQTPPNGAAPPANNGWGGT